MSYATVMVHVDIDEPSEPRMQLAAGVARHWGARLIGLCACAPRPSNGAGFAGTAEQQQIAAAMARRETEFRKIANGMNRPVEWRQAIDLPVDALVREARAADLIVIGNKPRSHDLYRALDPGSVLLKAGRPVLATPPSLNTLRWKRILIAWQDTREARRAVRDALPFLSEADEVQITEIREHRSERTDGHVDDVAKYLQQHRITTSAGMMLKAPSARVGEELLRVAEMEMSDLIVAGAYGHSRLGEWIFGGVTRDLLNTGSVSCLFSH